MKSTLAIYCFLALTSSSGTFACEEPANDSYYLSAMQEERELTTAAIDASDQVFVGTVTTIQAGPAAASPSDRISVVEVTIGETLMGASVSGATVSLDARLHYQIVACFGNEDFWDDQVEVGGDYIFFVSGGKILSASPPARSWRRLGLSGQREIVLALTKHREEP